MQQFLRRFCDHPNRSKLRGIHFKIKLGGSITAIEGDHGSAYFHPDSLAARRAIDCQVRLQKLAGENAMIGRELYPLLTRAGFSEVSVSPRMVYADGSRPAMADGFTRKTFTAMIEGVREAALADMATRIRTPAREWRPHSELARGVGQTTLARFF
jgi:hypothetical protein